jgi:small subunit ribosomal protein S20
MGKLLSRPELTKKSLQRHVQYDTIIGCKDLKKEVNPLPNIKSAMKRVKTSKKENVRNRGIRSTVKTILKKYNAAVENDVEQAAASLPAVNATLDKAVAKGVMHKNAANRHKANAAKKLDAATKA